LDPKTNPGHIHFRSNQDVKVVDFLPSLRAVHLLLVVIQVVGGIWVGVSVSVGVVHWSISRSVHRWVGVAGVGIWSCVKILAESSGDDGSEDKDGKLQ
jgi:hypothetical protein